MTREQNWPFHLCITVCVQSLLACNDCLSEGVHFILEHECFILQVILQGSFQEHEQLHNQITSGSVKISVCKEQGCQDFSSWLVEQVLWSVSKKIIFTQDVLRKLQACASFSTYVQCRSISTIDLEAYAVGCTQLAYNQLDVTHTKLMQ